MFVRLKGPSGRAREFLALVSTASEYCLLPKADALSLGYPEVANTDRGTRLENEFDFVSCGAYGRGILVKINEVDLGPIQLKDVEFVTYDILQVTGFDVVLGKNILQNMKFEVDFASRKLKLERATA